MPLLIYGIGLDIVELNRIATIDRRTEKFRLRILDAMELEQYEHLSPERRIEFLAGRFAAKEAFAKAKGTGIGTDCRFTDIRVIANELGQPTLYFRDERVQGFVSITHTQTVAAAQVILLTEK